MRLIHGNCLDVMPTLDAGSVDCVVTDPPYGLEFMGKEWDKLWRNHSPAAVSYLSGAASAFTKRQRKQPIYRAGKDAQEWHHAWAAAALRVLKPAGYMLAFGGTRTYHRLACAIEDAGFEIRDCVMWLYGSGFPKAKSCLKPAWEPVLLCRKPGGKVLPLGIDGCRVPHNGRRSPCKADGTVSRNSKGVLAGGHHDSPSWDTSIGRWPANVVHDGSDEVMEAFAAFGERGGGYGVRGRGGDVYGSGRGYTTDFPVTGQTVGHGDTGTAARFFYCAKSSRAEREAGLDGPASVMSVWGGNEDDLSEGKKSVRPSRNHHPTVKPLALMRWLCRLVCPPGGTVLDPFMGSGTTGIAGVQEGFDFIGIEREAEYYAIAEKRIAAAQAKEPLFAGVG